ncbi:hypothetical protein ACJ73_09268, partial [Blastomyces percursus]
MSASRSQCPRGTPLHRCLYLHLHTEQACPSTPQNASAGLHSPLLPSSPPPSLAVLSAVLGSALHGAVSMPKRRRSLLTSSYDGDSTDESPRLDTNSESDQGYETELTELESDASCDRSKGKRKRQQLCYKPNRPAPEKDAAAAATDDWNDDTDSKDDTDDEISTGDEDDDYSPGTRILIARLEDHWQ